MPNDAPAESVTWQEIEELAHRFQFGILDEHRGLDGWTREWLDPRLLRDMHGDFRGAPLHKEALFVALLKQYRPAIEDGTFPYAGDIKRQWHSKPPIVVERDPTTREMYVADGELRTLNACYRQDPWIEALVIELDQGRGAVELPAS